MCKRCPQMTTMVVLFLFCSYLSMGQAALDDQVQGLNYHQIYAYGLDANIKPAIRLLNSLPEDLSAKDADFKKRFLERFEGGERLPLAKDIEHEGIRKLVQIFHSYWRQSMLDTSQNFDGQLARQIIPFLKKNYPASRDLEIQRDSIGSYLSRYIRSQGFYTTEKIGKTGRLIDLPIWQVQIDTLYSFQLHKEKMTVSVKMMKDFISLGWLEFATLGRHYPGGWAKDDGLYCVVKAYDLDSESFRVSYLAHEGRHFNDYQLFPNLVSADLEYRAKLTELSLAKGSLYDLLDFFSRNGNADSKNPHQLANYHVIEDLTKELFKKGQVPDSSLWKTQSIKKIHRKALRLLKRNTKKLRKQGVEVKSLLQSL